jgi:hypothetical protein
MRNHGEVSHVLPLRSPGQVVGEDLQTRVRLHCGK